MTRYIPRPAWVLVLACLSACESSPTAPTSLGAPSPLTAPVAVTVSATPSVSPLDPAPATPAPPAASTPTPAPSPTPAPTDPSAPTAACGRAQVSGSLGPDGAYTVRNAGGCAEPVAVIVRRLGEDRGFAAQVDLPALFTYLDVPAGWTVQGVASLGECPVQVDLVYGLTRGSRVPPAGEEGRDLLAFGFYQEDKTCGPSRCAVVDPSVVVTTVATLAQVQTRRIWAEVKGGGRGTLTIGDLPARAFSGIYVEEHTDARPTPVGNVAGAPVVVRVRLTATTRSGEACGEVVADYRVDPMPAPPVPPTPPTPPVAPTCEAQYPRTLRLTSASARMSGGEAQIRAVVFAQTVRDVELAIVWTGANGTRWAKALEPVALPCGPGQLVSLAYEVSATGFTQATGAQYAVWTVRAGTVSRNDASFEAGKLEKLGDIAWQ